MSERTLPTAMHRGGAGTPLLLLHGFSVSWRAWLPILPALEADHDVYAPTLAGHHGAAALADGTPPSVESLADAIETQLDEQQMPQPHVAGNSLGGWLALELARRGRARSVVAFSPAGAWRSQRDFRRLSRLIRAGRHFAEHAGPRTEAALRRPRLRRLGLRAALEHGERLPAREIPGMFEEIRGCTIFDAFGAAIEDAGPIRQGTMDSIACPVRIAWAQRDRTIPFERYGRPLLELVPGAELVMLPGVGHAPMYDDPHLVARTVLEVTRTVDARA